MDQQAPRYKPIKVTDAAELDGMGRAVRAKRVDYQLADGTQSYVVIPHTEYNVENLQAALEQAANQHEAIMRVRGNPIMPGDMTSNPWERNTG